jgi:predicted nucleic acid-binding protein
MIRQRIGIDTSILVRLVTGEPPDIYAYCLERLSELVAGGVEVFASNQVIGEAYVTTQLHYGIAKEDARAGLLHALTSGLVAPLNGAAVIEALSAPGVPGLFDRLIADDYSRAGLETLTLDRSMASLPGVRRLRK